jgi:hypothetical protein
VNLAQVKRLRELPQLILNERDPDKARLLRAELRDLASLELDEIRSKFLRRCPTCGIELGVHTAQMLEECARKQRRDD